MTKKLLPIAIIALSLAMIVSIAHSAMRGPSTAPRAEELRAARRIERVPGGSIDTRIDRPRGSWIGGNGVVEPREPETRLSAAVPGRIVAIHAREGAFVEAGALLVELEHDAEQAALAAVDADARGADAELARTRRGLRREDVDATLAESESARARADLSAGVLSRLERLAPEGAVTPDELDRARRQADADRFTAATSRARRDAALAGSRVEDVRAAAARLSSAEARRDQARAALERLFVRAPIAGEILEVKYRVGEHFAPGGAEPLLVMGDMRRLHVRMDVDELDVAHVVLGAHAFVVAEAYGARRFGGRVVEVGRRMGRRNLRTDDPVERIDTKVLEVVIELDAGTRLVPGLRTLCYVSASDTRGTDSRRRPTP